MTDDPTLTPDLTAYDERSLLGCALHDPGTARELLRLVKHPDWFADARLARAWSALRRALAGVGDDPVMLPDAVARELAGDGGDAPTLDELIAIAKDVGRMVGNAAYYAGRVRAAYVRRTAVGMLSETDLERNRDLATADLLAGVQERFRQLGELHAGADTRRRAVPVAEIAGNRPERLLHCAGRKGALLSVGGVLVLAGEGGIAKTPLALAMAAGMAARPDGSYGPLHGGLFAGAGAPVLIVGYEDAPAVSADRLRKLARAWWPIGDAPALRRVHVLNLAGRALFGPAAGELYGARPGPLPGWADVWDEAERIGARLVVIDPALCAYVGDANAAAPVRDFMGALAEAAEAARCGVLMIAHSRKDARKGNKDPDPFDPGNVAGSTHWTDAARGALTLTWEAGAEAGARVLAVSKANYGPARILAAVDPVRSPRGEIVGFAGGPWQTPAERNEAPRERRRDGARPWPGTHRMSDVDALRDRLIAERLTARTAKILAAVARVEYYNRQYNASARTVDALTCPPALAALTPAALADWAPRTLLEVRGEVVSRLADSLLAAPDPGPLAAWPPPGDWPPALLDALDPARGARAVFALAVAWLNGEAPGAVGVAWLMVRVHAAWCTAPKPPLHPLAPLVDAWQQRPQAESMVDDDRPRIMPRAVAHIENNAESYYLARFGPAVHRDAGGQLLMGFAEEGERGPTLPANVWTMGLAEAEKRGAVVPLALRIWIAAVLHTPMHARHGNYPILLNQSDGSALTLRRFLRWVYPSRPPKPNEYWPRILRAREVINATELPYADARGNLWGRQVVRLDTPYTRPGLDDPWPTIVHLPPGDGTGARVAFERLQYWWTRDAAATRALINLAYRWHIEGKRMMPAPGGNHWLQLRDPHLYDRLTDADIDALCFPPGTGIRRRDMRIAEGRRVLDKLVREGDAEWRDGRLLPPPPMGSTLA